MGYDMHMVQTPTKLPAKYRPPNRKLPGYYRQNLSGMEITLGAMEWADCLHYEPAPELPAFPPPGFRGKVRAEKVVGWLDALRAGFDEPTKPAPKPAEVEAAARYLDARAAVLSRSSWKDGSVGRYKWESNDGWLVTPEECVVVATKVRAETDVIASDFFPDAGISSKDGRRWLEDWAFFHEIAAKHGGYHVR